MITIQKSPTADTRTCWTCGYKSGSGHVLVGGCNWHQAHGKHEGPKPFTVDPNKLKACIVDKGCGHHTTEKWKKHEC